MSRFRSILWLLPISTLILLLFGMILSSSIKIDFLLWQHLTRYLLSEAIFNTLLIGVVTSLLVWILGVPTAWIVSVYKFPLRSFFAWVLIMPIAIPPFIMSIAFIDIFDYSGLLQSFLRELTGSNNQFWEIRSPLGLAITLSFCLYPYVYLFSRAAFITQGQSLLEAANVLGTGRLRTFLKMSAGLSKPWWLAAIILIWMEIISDFGAFMAFGVSNLTTVIYKTWLGLFDLSGALQLSFFLATFAMILMIVQNFSLSKKKYFAKGKSQYLSSLSKSGQILTICWLGFIVSVSFLVPIIRLASWSFSEFMFIDYQKTLTNIWHTLILACLTALITTIFGLILAFTKRGYKDVISSSLIKIATIGYSIPAMVLAVGLFIPIIKFDNWQAEHFSGIRLLQGTIIITLLILVQRFNNVSYNAIYSALGRVQLEYEQIAKTFGASKWRVLNRIYFPLVNKGMIVGFLLVFVEVLKELPIVLTTRPFGWNTLSVWVYELTSSGMFEQAGMPSLIIIITGMIPVFLITNYLEIDINGK